MSSYSDDDYLRLLAKYNDAHKRLEAAEARAVELERHRHERDRFIVDQGLWSAFVASLPAPAPVSKMQNLHNATDPAP